MSEDKPAKKPGRLAEIRQAYAAIKSVDPQVGWWMLGGAVLSLAAVVLFGWWLGHPYLSLLSGLPLALLVATLIMNRRGNKAMYGVLEGQPGGSGATLQSMGRRGWYTSEQPVAVEAPRGAKLNDLTGAAFVFRALGRPGVVLIGEGPRARVDKLLKAEEKRTNRVAPGVPVHTWVVGPGEDEVPLAKITNRLTRMRSVMTKDETAMVYKRLQSLGGVKAPIPAGMDPRQMRANRKALRGK